VRTRISLCRTVRFHAVHRLRAGSLGPEENQTRFGWTTEPHAHDYACEVTVSGPVDERIPTVMDLPALDQILQDEVLARFDGRTLHEDVPEFHHTLPTCEGLARDVFGRVSARLPSGVMLVRVTVAEDNTLRAECRVDDR
jgi:6-pyruvoyltetrahydropterin/6-carboxytetrahydropterin synthase